MTTSIFGPYHFVPLSEWVYMPDWAHITSHDVPFKDGISGEIKYLLQNFSPLCVGGNSNASQDDRTVRWVKNPKNQLVIPGSTLKGLIRNTVEIAAFGKFSAIDDNTFAYRDISSDSKYLANVSKLSVQSAWLKYQSDQNEWQLTFCKHAKIKHTDLNKALNIAIKNEEKAIAKYTQLPLSKQIQVDIEGRKQKQGIIDWAVNVGKGSTPSHIIFCNNRIKGKGKAEDYEFSYCFYDPQPSPLKTNANFSAVVQSFIQSHDEEQVNYLLNHSNSHLGIPVFVLFDKDKKAVHSIGLAKMPRILYKHSTRDVATHTQRLLKGNSSSAVFDLAELMFGTLREQALSLKSRVMFTDAIIQQSTGTYISDYVTLNNPKATFKGAYLEQPYKRKYQDYDDNNSKLSGWKRYFIQDNFKENQTGNDNINVKTKLELLKTGSKFIGTIYFHNLKPEELGALIWALEFESKECFHGLGHGKPLGAGKVQFSIQNVTGYINSSAYMPHTLDASHYKSLFVDHMNHQYPGVHVNWQQSPQIKHLIAMSKSKTASGRDLDYPELKAFKGFINNKATLEPIKEGDQIILRNEELDKSRFNWDSLNQGRLKLLTTEFSNEQWLKEAISEKEIAQQKRELEQQTAEKEKLLASLSDDAKQVKAIEFSLAAAKTDAERENLNKQINELINSFVETTVDKTSVVMLIELIEQNTHCAYLKISNKKKLKARKQEIADLKARYDLS
jgi:CRISPR-associated protein (TIGR03986 family)